MSPDVYIRFYLMGMMITMIMYPIIRDIVMEQHALGRVEGESGLVYVIRGINTTIAWPAIALYLLWIFASKIAVPWMINPKD